MKVLVTGGAGFIGFHVAKKLLERGDSVVVVDNFNDYYDVSLKISRAELIRKSGAEIIKMDISDYEALEKIFRQHEFDKVCHLAAQAGVRYSMEYPFVYSKSNVLGTHNVLELCKEHGVKDVVLASSSSVYGNNKKVPFCEDDRVDNPISVYAATKKSNEELAYTYHHLYGLNCTCLRFFTVYGPWGRPDMALFKFTQLMLDDKDIPVFNHGNMKRDFTYIDDIVDGVIAAIDKPFPYEIINLARGECRTLLEYIDNLEKHLGIKAKIDMLPMQPGDVPQTHGDISKAKGLLEYEPEVSISEGVKKFVDWYREYYGIKE
ncbi:MAG: SDR family NAD(P)-dependent oxidoreductase [Candidatus Aenigmarchaeota archaeon]|nr:SDR family NAD(P)-dependent oxidoreductase [Candidatus Aenigmarchaeota archaeon]